MKSKSVKVRHFAVLISFILMLMVHCKKTHESLPSISTISVGAISAGTAHSGGYIWDDGGTKILEKGVCWSTHEMPTVADTRTNEGTGSEPFSSMMMDLLPNTTYFVRAYATNRVGTGYGEVSSFTTKMEYPDGKPCPGLLTFNDIDNNVYNTVLINDQCWMGENLKTTRYSDGTQIDNPGNASAFLSNTLGAYSWYDFNPAWKMPYGALYNWYAVNNSKGLCPQGWRVPTEEDMNILIEYLGGDEIAGGKMKSTKTGSTNDPHPRWDYPNAGATNESGWSAMPGGRFEILFETFNFMTWHGVWWTSSGLSPENAISFGLSYEDVEVFRGHADKSYGFSVRCLKE